MSLFDIWTRAQGFLVLFWKKLRVSILILKNSTYGQSVLPLKLVMLSECRRTRHYTFPEMSIFSTWFPLWTRNGTLLDFHFERGTNQTSCLQPYFSERLELEVMLFLVLYRQIPDPLMGGARRFHREIRFRILLGKNKLYLLYHVNRNFELYILYQAQFYSESCQFSFSFLFKIYKYH